LNTSLTQATGLVQYPNTPDGLREFLSELRAAAKSGDQAKVDSLIKQAEIPEYRNWFCSVYVPGSGLSWAIPYGNNLAQSEQAFKALWEKLAQDDGEIRVQWLVIHTRTSLDHYQADWKSKTGAPDERIGMFYYIDGMFRLDSTVRRVPVARVSPGGGVGGGIFRVGGGVSAPHAIYSPNPEYSEQASKAKLEGTCVLSLIVGVDGKAHGIKVVTPLGKGLDEKAINAVNTWKFEPGKKDGVPVATQIEVMVEFHLK
jgi:TonB family protein